MKLSVDEKDYVISDDAFKHLTEMVATEAITAVNKMPPMIMAMIETFARNKLYELEKQIIKDGGTKEDALILRPDKGQNPSTKLLIILLAALKDMSKYAEVGLRTDGNGTISDFSYKFEDTSKTGG